VKISISKYMAFEKKLWCVIYNFEISQKIKLAGVPGAESHLGTAAGSSGDTLQSSGALFPGGPSQPEISVF
jgi:hypothetical protein